MFRSVSVYLHLVSEPFQCFCLASIMFCSIEKKDEQYFFNFFFNEVYGIERVKGKPECLNFYILKEYTVENKKKA